MPAKASDKPLEGEALVKEVNRLIRLARSYWDAHNNLACQTHRDKALALYARLDPAQKEQIPQVLRVWLRYRSEKYFGTQSGRGAKGKPAKNPKKPPKPRQES